MKIKIKEKLYNLDDIINFGERHKGETIKSVLESDSQYLVWAHETVFFFKLEPFIYAEALKEKQNQKEYDEEWMDYTGIEDVLGHYPGDS